MWLRVITRKIFKNFLCVLKVTGTDPRIRIRTKMSRIPHTDEKNSLTGTGYLVECTHVEVKALVNPGPRLSILE
jgi:hypothetical protein